MICRSLLVLGFAASSFARSVPQRIARQEPSTTASASDAQSTICGKIIDAVNEGYSFFAASDAYECLTSVPFNSAVASRFIAYWNETLQFQTTLAYLKNPPEGYQQPAVDFETELGKIQQRVDAGAYRNQYDFEADVQLLTYALKDGHVILNAGILSAFSFGSPYEITSASIDGKQAPKIYITDDLLPEKASQPWTPSPIVTINGTEVNEFISTYAALNSWGYVEPHAEWNDLMSHPTLDILGGLTTFSGAGTFYPGDNLTFTYENGTSKDTIWVAIYNEPANATGPLTTGGDFYNYFVLGLLPASFEPVASPLESSGTVQAAPGNWSEASFGAFPEDPDIVQYDLGVYYTGLVSGYFYKDISTGVLSLPSFDGVPETLGNWTDTVSYFVRNISTAGVDRVVIDLQRNSGGTPLLAFTTFKEFFPDLFPFAGSRRRSFDVANVMGSATTEWWSSLSEANETEEYIKYDNAANEWVITDRLNAVTGSNFSSWSEYQGPIRAQDDEFSLVEQYDLANPTFDTAAFDEWIPTWYLPENSIGPFLPRPVQADRIVLLTDGLCASACALFVEMMTQAGAKTVVAGGRPTKGPMQAASGTRGARSYDTWTLDNDMIYARSLDESVATNVNATVPEIRDSAMFVKYGGFNLRDQIRKEDTTPLQFKYEAADCRIYYTVDNIYNMTRLWHDVSAAAFTDSSLCVEGSTGFSKTNNTNPIAPPQPDAQKPVLSLNTTSIAQAKWDDDDSDSFHAAVNSKGTRNKDPFPLCVPVPLTGGQGCTDAGSVCRQVSVYCTKDKAYKNPYRCVSECRNQPGSKCHGSCKLDSPSAESKPVYANAAGTEFSEKLSTGYCYPSVGTKALGCSADG
ncbi:hypothetical protein C7974DRAFT_158490 [Boeremia exigua]|uniref:uncharacterized protein n=1 Tax=Boeremia exigua TaxID=749465 RepID=UPI001E8E6826|nr:uncharacterized protein C7974DRAFT_158490 [Boeremia exigua]KAH6638299.1 hypothetical protein C7974DRAFT_158490 [Boeremia exigua]